MAKKINSKAKGSRFERVVCKALQDWSGYEFSRTPASGGLRWKKTDNISSDIVCSDPKHAHKFPFSIEVKNYKDIKFEHLLTGNKTCKIREFWSQATGDAKRSGKIPVLIMRYNSMPKGEAFFVVGPALTQWIFDRYYIKCMNIYLQDIQIGVFMFKEIQKEVKYKDLYKFSRNFLK